MSKNHSNPFDVGDVSDDERAEMLREYLEALIPALDNPGMLRLMHLGEEGKEPAITGRCALDSMEARELLATPPEAVERLRNGAQGFCLYAGKRSHGTEKIVLVDHDDGDVFPLDTLPDTLTVLSGSGRGHHETFSNAGDVRNGKSDAGEVRAKNWYCVLPGSVHPSGGLYHVVSDRDPVELCESDIPESLRPGTLANRDGSDVDVELKTGRVPDAGFRNPAGVPLEEFRGEDDKLDDLLAGLDSGYASASEADLALCSKLVRLGYEPQTVADIWLAFRSRPKVEERPGYVERTIDKALAGADKLSFAGLRVMAVHLGVLDEDDFVERTGDNGETYRGFPDGVFYRVALLQLEEHGLDHGREDEELIELRQRRIERLMGGSS